MIADSGCRRSEEGASQGPEGSAQLVEPKANIPHLPQIWHYVVAFNLRLERAGPTLHQLSISLTPPLPKLQGTCNRLSRHKP